MGSLGDNDLEILDVSFNQDEGLFSVAHERGFLVYNSNPIDLRVKRLFTPSGNAGTGIGHIAMLHRTNYVALVGGGRDPKFPNNKVIIWDDLKKKTSLSLSFMHPVLRVLMSRVRIVVILSNQVVVYEFSAPPRKLATYETCSNLHGIVDLSAHTSALSFPGISNVNFGEAHALKDHVKNHILVFPSRAIGQIQLIDISPEGQESKSASIIKAHKSNIRCLALSRLGALIASASETGTIIRVHSTHTTALLLEFRRGLDRAIITSMRFSPDGRKLAVLSDKNTLHVFNITTTNRRSNSETSMDNGRLKESPTNREHILNKLHLPIPIPNYFKSTWSYCSVNTNKYHQNAEGLSDLTSDVGVLGWSSNDTIILVWRNRAIWEKYVITETANNSDTAQPTYELTRYAWKSIGLTDD